MNISITPQRKWNHVCAALLLVFASFMAYHGAVLLGYGTDNWSDLNMYTSLPLSRVAANPVYNRYPTWSLLVYPILLWSPMWLAHLLVVAAHTFAAWLLVVLLRWFTLDHVTATIAGLLFLLWPAHVEALFWIPGAMFIFTTLFALAGAYYLTQQCLVIGTVLMLLGLFSTEAIFFPALVLMAAIAWRARFNVQQTAGIFLTFVGVYAVFQVIRFTYSDGRDFTPYATGFLYVWPRALSWMLMSLGLASSSDVSWMWSLAGRAVDSGLLLPQFFLLLAGILVSGSALWLTRHFALVSTPLPWRKLLVGVGVTLLGYGSAFLIFLPLQGNAMQSRYTSIGVAYLVVLLALLLGRLCASKRRVVAATGVICTVALLSWASYRAWSNIWVNWYPARLLSDELLEDVRYAHKTTGSERIFLIDDPKAVGNAFAIGRDWGYIFAGRLVIEPRMIVTADMLVRQTTLPMFAAGNRFTDRPCVFVSWRSGKRIIASHAFEPNKQVVLNCETSFVEPLNGRAVPQLTIPGLSPGTVTLSNFLGIPTDDPLQILLALLRR